MIAETINNVTVQVMGKEFKISNTQCNTLIRPKATHTPGFYGTCKFLTHPYIKIIIQALSHILRSTNTDMTQDTTILYIYIYIYIYNVYLSQKKQQISPFYRPIRGKGMTRERFLRSAVAMSMDEN